MRHDALSLHTAASQEQATIAHRAEQDGAGGRQISIRIEIFGDAYSMGPYCLVYIVVSITMKISNRVEFIDKALIIKQYPLNCHCGFEGMTRGSASWRAGLPRGAETPFGSTFVA